MTNNNNNKQQQRKKTIIHNKAKRYVDIAKSARLILRKMTRRRRIRENDVFFVVFTTMDIKVTIRTKSRRKEMERKEKKTNKPFDDDGWFD